jgi:hypothetical protein
MSDKLRDLNDSMAYHMDAILALFKPGAKITVVVRNPMLPDGDVVIGNNDLDDTIETINRMKARKPQFSPRSSPFPPSTTTR